MKARFVLNEIKRGETSSLTSIKAGKRHELYAWLALNDELPTVVSLGKEMSEVLFDKNYDVLKKMLKERGLDFNDYYWIDSTSLFTQPFLFSTMEKFMIKINPQYERIASYKTPYMDRMIIDYDFQINVGKLIILGHDELGPGWFFKNK